MRLSVQESNLVSIYHSGTRSSTAEQIREALPYMDSDTLCAAQATLLKLEAMSGNIFSALNLDPEEVVIC